MADFKVITQDMVTVSITSSALQSTLGYERRFPKDLTIYTLKGKLELVTGANTATMKIELYNKDDKYVCELNNNDALLGSYPVDDGMRLHVIDNFNLCTEFQSSKVEKFELTDEEYAKKPDSLKAFLKKNKLGKYNEEQMKERKEQLAKEKAEEEKLIAAITVGSRCLVTVNMEPERRGEVKFVGKVEGLNGYWVGVHYDEPVGKNDGSIDGVRYFTCPQKYGGFVKPANVKCGDYPEIDFLEDDEI